MAFRSPPPHRRSSGNLGNAANKGRVVKPVIKPKFWIAHYRCRTCHYEFKAEAGPNTGYCPLCNGLWLDWLNYEELRRRS